MRSRPWRPDTPQPEIDVFAGLHAMARRATAHQSPSSRKIDLRDLMVKVRERPCNRLIVVVVDASESMGEGTVARMTAAKGAVLALLTIAYQARHRVALIAFREQGASVLLPPAAGVAIAERRLRRLAAGGATPLADGLRKARELIHSARFKTPGIRPLLVLISDGEANVPQRPGGDPVADSLHMAGLCRQANIDAVAIDTKTAAVSAGEESEMQALARELGGRYCRATQINARTVIQAIRDGS